MALAAAAALLSVGAQADDGAGKAYVIASVGQAKVDLGDDEDAFRELDAIFSSTPGFVSMLSIDDKDTTFAFGGGYQFNPYLAVEGYYHDFGEAKADISATDGIDFFQAQAEYTAAGPGIGVIGLLPVNDALSVYARLDAVHLKVEAEQRVVSSFGINVLQSADDTKLQLGYGIGVQYGFGNGFALRADLQHIEAEVEDSDTKADIDSLNMAVVKSF